MVWAKLDDAILDNPKIAEAGIFGFALHVAAITWCCRNLTDGFVPRPRVSCLLDFGGVMWDRENPAGVPGDAESMGGRHGADPLAIAEYLVEVGLWREDAERNGFWLHDFLDYNPSREKVLSERQRGAERKQGSRADAPAKQTRSRALSARTPRGHATESVTASDGPVPDPVPVKISLTEDRSDPILAPTRITPRSDPCPTPEPESATGVRVKPGTIGPPVWFATAVDVVAMATGVTLPVGEAWLRYDGHRETKGMARTPSDAQYWLTGVMVPEAREILRVTARDKDRDAAFAQGKRFARAGPEPPPKLTKQQSEAFAEQLAARMGLARKAGT